LSTSGASAIAAAIFMDAGPYSTSATLLGCLPPAINELVKKLGEGVEPWGTHRAAAARSRVMDENAASIEMVREALDVATAAPDGLGQRLIA
jgi:hypothetical protein